jgi:hypothetical protein
MELRGVRQPRERCRCPENHTDVPLSWPRANTELTLHIPSKTLGRQEAGLRGMEEHSGVFSGYSTSAYE